LFGCSQGFLQCASGGTFFINRPDQCEFLTHSDVKNRHYQKEGKFFAALLVAQEPNNMAESEFIFCIMLTQGIHHFETQHKTKVCWLLFVSVL